MGYFQMEFERFDWQLILQKSEMPKLQFRVKNGFNNRA